MWGVGGLWGKKQNKERLASSESLLDTVQWGSQLVRQRVSERGGSADMLIRCSAPLNKNTDLLPQGTSYSTAALHPLSITCCVVSWFISISCTNLWHQVVYLAGANSNFTPHRYTRATAKPCLKTFTWSLHTWHYFFYLQWGRFSFMNILSDSFNLDHQKT